jgi:phosphatidate cytidylyltransferase
MAGADRTVGAAVSGELGKRVLSGVTLGLAGIVGAWFGSYLFILLLAFAAVAVWWEWSAIVQGRTRLASLASGIAAFTAAAISLALGATAIAIVCAIIGAGVAAAIVPHARHWMALGVIYAAAVLIPPVMLRDDAAVGLVAIYWLFAIVWAGDTGAYFSGRTVGGPKLAPSISPSKTWSGAVGGALASIVAGIIVLAIAGLDVKLVHGLLALIMSVASQLGDLLESAFKRRFGVKDASTLIPGHGGAMDRLDGFLVAAMVAVVIGFARGGFETPAVGLLRW